MDDRLPVGGRVDPRLVEAWLGARSLARALPQPVHDGDALRVDTGLPDERRRFVFAAEGPGLTAVAREIDDPLVVIKLAGAPADLAARVGPRWRVLAPPSHMMVAEAGAKPDDPALPPGFNVEVSTQDGVTTASVLDADGALAASGHAAEHAGVFAYDRIVTLEPFRRRGLGSVVMAALGAARRSPASQPVLVATAEGRALYTRLGWRVVSPWSTARPVGPAG